MGNEGREDHEEIPAKFTCFIQQIKRSLPFCCLVSSSFVSCSSFFLPFFFQSADCTASLLGALCLLLSWSHFLFFILFLLFYLPLLSMHLGHPPHQATSLCVGCSRQQAPPEGNRHFLSWHLASVVLLGSFKWQSPLPYWELYTVTACIWCLPA